MASIVKRGTGYSVVYRYEDELGQSKQKWGVSMYSSSCGLINNYINPIMRTERSMLRNLKLLSIPTRICVM